MNLRLCILLAVVAGCAAVAHGAPTEDGGGGGGEQVSDGVSDGEVQRPEVGLELVLAYCALGAMAFVPIWVGAHASVATIGPGGVTKSDDDETVYAEAMSTHDAKMFPVIGTGVLVTLFVLFKVFKLKEYVNMILTLYFVALGVVAVTLAFVKPAFKRIRALALQDESSYELNINFKFWDVTAEPTKLAFSNLDLIAGAVSLAVCVWYAMYKHWVANNVIALAFCIEGLRSLSIGSFTNGAILLSGLFFYDIFHVFYSHHIFGASTMVTVARGLNAPIAVKFPRAVFTSFNSDLSLLGLGDIVLPGVFLALLLRFDAQRVGASANTYFIVTYISYVIGLVTTVVVMHVFHAAQPALLYLVPAVLAASCGTAVVRGEFADLLAYSEGAPEGSDADSVDA